MFGTQKQETTGIEWNTMKSKSLPSSKNLQDVEVDGWLVFQIVPDSGMYYVYLRRTRLN